MQPAPGRRPLLTLPGIDFDYYPELEADGAMARFNDLEGCFEIPFPYGFPYMDFQVIDLQNVRDGSLVFPIKSTGEIFLLEQLTFQWPGKGAGAYPDTAPTGGESSVPTVQITSSNPNLRNGRYVASGPAMFSKPVLMNQLGGPGQIGSKAIRLDNRRLIPFSERDTITFDFTKFDNVDPRWIGVGIIGRLVTPQFLQGIIE